MGWQRGSQTEGGYSPEDRTPAPELQKKGGAYWINEAPLREEERSLWPGWAGNGGPRPRGGTPRRTEPLRRSSRRREGRTGSTRRRCGRRSDHSGRDGLATGVPDRGGVLPGGPNPCAGAPEEGRGVLDQRGAAAGGGAITLAGMGWQRGSQTEGGYSPADPTPAPELQKKGGAYWINEAPLREEERSLWPGWAGSGGPRPRFCSTHCHPVRSVLCY